jgi:hypothetical protein
MEATPMPIFWALMMAPRALTMPPEKRSRFPAPTAACPPAEINPLLLMPPENTEPATKTAVPPADIVPRLPIPPIKVVANATTPFCAEIVPLLVTPPPKVWV